MGCVGLRKQRVTLHDNQRWYEYTGLTFEDS